MIYSQKLFNTRFKKGENILKKKSFFLLVTIIALSILPFVALAETINIKKGVDGAKKFITISSDLDIELFGHLKTFPHYIHNVDFNSDDTAMDFIFDECGAMTNESIRNEIRLGLKAKGENWSFLIAVESDFVLNKPNGDRIDTGDGDTEGDDFGVEKLNFGYNFGLFQINTGWADKFLDINTGGILYGDDHPFIGFSGKLRSVKWEALYLIIQDDLDFSGGSVDENTLDWRVYTLKTFFNVSNLTLAPMYAFSDNDEHDAKVHYIGMEVYGKLGMITPRFEIIYATGDQDTADGEKDIDAWAAYASVEFAVSNAFNPYIGAYYYTGDNDSNDDEIEAFNGITNISRYSPTFGIENALIYRYIPALGTTIYSNTTGLLGQAEGYGGVSNGSKADTPGTIMLGLGVKGTIKKVSYKAQIMHFMFEDTGAIEQIYGKKIDDQVGTEFDIHLTYKFNKHFSLGNVFAIFHPGDGVQDIRGDKYDETAIMNTVELIWRF